MASFRSPFNPTNEVPDMKNRKVVTQPREFDGMVFWSTLLLLVCIWTLLTVALTSHTVIKKVEVVERTVIDCQKDGHVQFEDTILIGQIMKMYRIDLDLSQEISRAVTTASVLYDIDPQLILAVIKVESNGQPRARSSAGALGIMQILPSTGKDIAAELGESWTGSGMLFNVDINIRFGTYYLRFLFNRFNSMQQALAAYNWGPGYIETRIRNKLELPSEYPIKVLAALPAN